MWTEGAGWNKGGSLAWQAFDRGGEPIAGQAGRADGVPAWSVPAAVWNRVFALFGGTVVAASLAVAALAHDDADSRPYLILELP